MTNERKILIALGSLIIASIIAVACFSLGVYVGSQGWTLSRPALTGPQPQRDLPWLGQPGPAPQQPDAPANPQPQPTLTGIVQRIDKGNIAVRTGEGLRQITLTERTRLAQRTPEGQLIEITMADIQTGAGVAVLGTFSQDGRVLIADAVILLPPRTP